MEEEGEAEDLILDKILYHNVNKVWLHRYNKEGKPLYQDIIVYKFKKQPITGIIDKFVDG